MNLQIRLALEGVNLKDYAQGVHLRLAKGARDAAETMAARAKLALRDDVRRAGLGDRLANTWRSNVYPRSASAHTHSPAVLVYSKAPLIISAFSDAQTIVARNARWLAIPTENVPRKGKKRMTPLDVEGRFNQDLILIHGRGQQMLAFVDVLRAKNGKGFRRKTKGRAGRASELVLMFVMVRQVHTKKLLDTARIFSDLEAQWGELFASTISNAVNAGSNA